ncbi:MAG: O-antigen ligase [Tissierellia bacterium]|nr:O-antigen ligase [Tissierellia bacterium]
MNKLLIIIFSVFCITLMYNVSGPFDNFSNGVYFSSIIIQIISIFYIFSKSNQSYSLKKIFYLFSLFFFGIAPLLQYYKGIALWGSIPLNENEYIYINIIIIVILFLYQLFYVLFYSKRIKVKKVDFIAKLEVNRKLNKLQSILLVSISFFSFYMIYRLNNYSILSMLFRGGEFKEFAVVSSTAGLIISNVFRPLSMMSLLYYITSKSNNFIIYIILTISTFITCSPIGMARFQAATMYIPLVLLTIPWLRRKNNFVLNFILGLLVLFPFLDNFRNFESEGNLKIGFNFDMFLQGHFDSYHNFALIVNNNIITWGRQLLGVIFFWIPRSLWPNKPIGSGAYLAEEKSLIFSNISCNYFGEGFINFGFAGILFFVIFLAYITASFDKMYWTISVYKKNNYFNVIYYILLGLLFFMLRGDLMSSFAFTIGFMFSIWLVHKIAGAKVKTP